MAFLAARGRFYFGANLRGRAMPKRKITIETGWNPLYEAWRAKGFVRDGVFGWSRPMLEKVGKAEAMREEVLNIGRDHMDRQSLCGIYSWAVPSPQAIAWIAERCPRIFEVGAGRGYWAKVLSDAGCDVIASEPTVDGDDLNGNDWHSCPARVGLYFPLLKADSTASAQHPDRTLMMCWPPYSDPMAAQALTSYEGSRVLFIGEGDGGCCGGEDFWSMISNKWKVIGECELPQWPCIHDWVTLYERK